MFTQDYIRIERSYQDARLAGRGASISVIWIVNGEFPDGREADPITVCGECLNDDEFIENLRQRVLEGACVDIRPFSLKTYHFCEGGHLCQSCGNDLTGRRNPFSMDGVKK